MRKTLRFELILTIFVAICFTINSFYYMDFTNDGEFALPRLLLYLVMIIALINAGMIHKSLFNRGKRKNE